MEGTKRAFICHASEDKDRFVLGFARRLRAEGIDAWVDRWEILAGDSIVERIFEEGIKRADAMIVVLSRHSIAKRWVREELNTGVVKRIEEGIRIIPVVVDDCVVPESLKSIRRIQVSDLASYEMELAEIVRAILGAYERPTLGAPPGYARTVIDALPGLAKIDSIVLKVIGDAAIQVGNRWIDGDDIEARCTPFGLDATGIREALEVLTEHNYVVPAWSSAQHLPGVEVTVTGFDLYARAYVHEYSQTFDNVTSALAGAPDASNRDIATSIGVPMRVVDHVFDMLMARGLIKFASSFGGYEHRTVIHVSPRLKRLGQ